MDYLNEKCPPVREIRLKAGMAHGGTSGTLEEDLRAGCLQNAGRSFSQSSGCQFTLSLALLNTFLKAVVVSHGPLGCGACSIASIGSMRTFKRMRDPEAEGLIFLNTNLTESEVIGGGEGKLEASILYADEEFNPEIIFVAIGCVPSLIGDDVEAVCDKLQNVVKATLVPIHCSGFKTKIMATAYDDVYHGVLTKIIRGKTLPEKVISDDESALKEKILKKRRVNILNVTSMARQDELELERLISSLDLDVRFLICHGGKTRFAEALESSLNVSICGTHDDYFLEHLRSVYKIPFILDVMPVGPQNTARWIRLVADFFGKRERADKLILSEEKLLEEAVAPMRESFKGKKAFLSGGELRVIATAELLSYLGLTVNGIKCHHYDKFARPALEQLKNHEEIPFLAATQQPFEHVNLVKRLKPDVFVGHPGGNNITAKLGLPILPLFNSAAGYMGYAGVFEVARRLKRILKNPSFNKTLSEKRHLPFKSSWYEKDPFSYIKRNAAEDRGIPQEEKRPAKA
jgi:nitrogenase molybdenum-iron protein alpha chain